MNDSAAATSEQCLSDTTKLFEYYLNDTVNTNVKFNFTKNKTIVILTTK